MGVRSFFLVSFVYRQLENNSFGGRFFFFVFCFVFFVVYTVFIFFYFGVFCVFWCFFVFLILCLDSSRFSPSVALIFVENYCFWTIFGPFLFFK